MTVVSIGVFVLVGMSGTDTNPAWDTARKPASRNAGRPSLPMHPLPRGIVYPSDAPPFGGGVKISIAEANQRVPWSLLVPTDEAANLDGLLVVWQTDVTPEVELVFESGIRVYELPSQMDDPATTFKNAIAEGFAGEVRTVRGHPALVSVPHVDDAGNQTNSVDFVEDGIDITIIGDTIPEELVRVAESLRPYSSISGEPS